MRQEGFVPFAALAALALAGCSGEKAVDAPAETVSDAAQATAKGMPDPNAGNPDGASSMAIPRAVQGRWGLVPADCTSTRGDAKGLLVIDATTLTFYESHAKLGTVNDADDNGIVGSYDFTGEGQSWKLDVAFDVEDDGKTLIRRDTGKDAAPATLTYTRCK